MCERHARKRLLVTINPNNVWQYFQLSISRDGDAHLKITDSAKTLSFDEVSGVYFEQESELVLCIGYCDDRADTFGFTGGVRELIA